MAKHNPAFAVAPQPDRTPDPLSVGHPLSWDLINKGTSLEGCRCNRDLT